MLAQSRKNALLNVYFVARVRSLAKISVNNNIVPISEENPENGFACAFIVWSVKGKRSFRKTPIPLSCPLSQCANGLRHWDIANENKMSDGYRERARQTWRSFIKLNVVITTASGWLERLVLDVFVCARSKRAK